MSCVRRDPWKGIHCSKVGWVKIVLRPKFIERGQENVQLFVHIQDLAIA